jgi:hypothetical protein
MHMHKHLQQQGVEALQGSKSGMLWRDAYAMAWNHQLTLPLLIRQTSRAFLGCLDYLPNDFVPWRRGTMISRLQCRLTLFYTEHRKEHEKCRLTANSINSMLDGMSSTDAKTLRCISSSAPQIFHKSDATVSQARTGTVRRPRTGSRVQSRRWAL